jgi:Fic family protein
MRGNPVGLSRKEQLEIRNALDAYAHLTVYDSCSIESLFKSHALMMGGGLMLGAGCFRQSSVEVYITEDQTRVMPSWKIIPEAMETIFSTLRTSSEPAIFKSIRFHFDFVNLHPFMDGNGRIARLWQTRLIMELHPLFEFLDVESMVFDQRDEYYRQIRIGQECGDIGGFVCFMLQQVRASLEYIWEKSVAVSPTLEQRLSIATEFFATNIFSRKDYVQLFKTISSVTASRDLAAGVEKGLLSRQGDKRTAVYRFN